MRCSCDTERARGAPEGRGAHRRTSGAYAAAAALWLGGQSGARPCVRAPTPCSRPGTRGSGRSQVTPESQRLSLGAILQWARGVEVAPCVSTKKDRCFPQRCLLRPQSTWELIRSQEVKTDSSRGSGGRKSTLSLLLQQKMGSQAQGPRQPKVAGVRGWQLLGINLLEVWHMSDPHRRVTRAQHHCPPGLPQQLPTSLLCTA